MKHLKLPGLCLLFMLFSAAAFAQDKVPINEPDYNKPKLFKDLPDRIPVNMDDLKTLVSGNTETGKDVQLRTADSKLSSFRGKVISSASKYNNKLQSVVIRSSDFNGATFTLSSSTQPDGTVRYSGRIINFQSGDLYELEKENDQYVLIKKNYYDLINE